MVAFDFNPFGKIGELISSSFLHALVDTAKDLMNWYLFCARFVMQIDIWHK